eukprot:3793020-Amphidinium_carterae.1
MEILILYKLQKCGLKATLLHASSLCKDRANRALILKLPSLFGSNFTGCIPAKDLRKRSATLH